MCDLSSIFACLPAAIFLNFMFRTHRENLRVKVTERGGGGVCDMSSMKNFFNSLHSKIYINIFFFFVYEKC